MEPRKTTGTNRILALVPAAILLAGGSLARAESPEAATTRADIQKTLGFVPGFILRAPEAMLPGFWQELKGLEMNPHTALPGKYKELIGLAVAAQLPCRYCIYAHTAFARANGASDEELREAVGLAALARNTSTVLDGAQLDEPRFRAELAQLIAHAKQARGQAPHPIAIVDAASTLEDIKQTMGIVPEFVRRIPAEALPGWWSSTKALQLSPASALPSKYKSLLGLAVASQIPSWPCVAADTELAKLAGATDRELNEAVAMAGLVRTGSALLNGLQIDEASFRKDIDRVVGGGAKAGASRGHGHDASAQR